MYIKGKLTIFVIKASKFKTANFWTSQNILPFGKSCFSAQAMLVYQWKNIMTKQIMDV